MAASVKDAVDGVTFVQESGPENVEQKQAIFAELDRLAPADALLASSTSAISCVALHRKPAGPGAVPGRPSRQSAASGAAGRTLRHALDHARDASTALREVYRGIGQEPVTVNSEIKGFILNRLQGALLAEAFRLVGKAIFRRKISIKTVKDGLGLRWSFIGPFETIELNAPGGIPDYCVRYTGIYKKLAAIRRGPEVYESPKWHR